MRVWVYVFVCDRPCVYMHACICVCVDVGVYPMTNHRGYYLAVKLNININHSLNHSLNHLVICKNTTQYIDEPAYITLLELEIINCF